MADNRVQITIAALDQTRAAFESVRQGFKNLTKDAESFRLQGANLSQTFKELVGTFSAYQAGSFLKSTIDVAEQTENSLRGLGAVARYAGEDLGQSMEAASRLAEDGLINVASASKALQNLLSRGFSLQESVEIINRLKDAAAFNRQSHLSMAQAVESATEGLKNENSVLVDNAGVTKNVSQMWKEYAASIGKGEKELTQAEKRTAEYNGILKETEAQIGNADLATKGLTGTKARLTTEVYKLKNALGNSLTPAFVELAKTANWVMQSAIIPFIAGIEIMATKAVSFFDKIKTQKELRRAKGKVIWHTPTAEEKARISELEARLEVLDQTKEEQIQDIIAKYTGALKIPELGKDSGKRREDSPATAGTGKNKKDKTAEEAAGAQKSLDELKTSLQGDIEQSWMDELDAKLAQIDQDAAKEKEKISELGKKGAKGTAEATALVDENAEREKSIVIGKWYEEELKAQAKASEELEKQQKATDESIQKGLKETQDETRQLYATREASLEIQLQELDIAEQAGMLHSDTLEKRLQLEREILATRQKDLAGIDKSKDESSWYAQLQKVIEAYRNILETQNQIKEQNGTLMEGWADGWKEYKNQAMTAFKAAKQMALETARAMETAFSDVFFDMIEGRFKSLHDYLVNFSHTVNRAMADVAGQWVTGKITGMLGIGGTQTVQNMTVANLTVTGGRGDLFDKETFAGEGLPLYPEGGEGEKGFLGTVGTGLDNMLAKYTGYQGTLFTDLSTQMGGLFDSFSGWLGGLFQSFMGMLSGGGVMNYSSSAGNGGLWGLAGNILAGNWGGAANSLGGNGGYAHTETGYDSVTGSADVSTANELPLYKHSGGVGREGTYYRPVLSSAFFGAPRFHSGIGPGEMAAIIRQEEGVFTPGQMKNMASLSSIVAAIKGSGASAKGGNSLAVNVPVNVNSDNKQMIAALQSRIEATVIRTIKDFT